MDDFRDDFADAAGRRLATGFVVLLGALFAYGYLSQLI